MAQRILDLDAFIPPPVTLSYRGQDHVLEGEHLNMELVLKLQVAIQRFNDAGDGEEEAAFEQMRGLLGDTLGKADPPLRLEEVPVGSWPAIAMYLMEATTPQDDDGEAEQGPPARGRTRKAGGRTTPTSSASTRPAARRGGAKGSGSRR